jgi:poly(beta-D-mannuronate) lyase
MKSGQRRVQQIQRTNKNVVDKMKPLFCLAITCFVFAPPARADTLPAAVRTVQVATSTQLSTALNNARPGDRIVLANATYSGRTITRSGQTDKPIVLVASTIHGPKFSGNIRIDGDYVWIVGMNMQNRGITINGAHDRVTRNRFRASIGPAIFANKTSRNAEIDHNEHAGGKITLASPDAPGASPIFMRYQCAEPSNHYVHHNYIHDGSGGANTSEAIMSGFGLVCNKYTRDPGSAGARIEYNLIQNYNAGYCLRTKSNDNLFAFNTCLNTDDVQNRHGSNNQWISNWFEGVEYVRIFDQNNIVMGNRLIGTTLNIGNGNVDPNTAGDGYIVANNAIVAKNDGPLAVGVSYPGLANAKPVKNVKVEAHMWGNGCKQGNVSCGQSVGTTFSSITERTIAAAFKLTTSQVGPFASTAPKP